MNRAKLKGLRVEKGFTQEKIAEALGISTYSYNLKEQGKRDFTDSEISKLGEILGVESSIFFAI